MSNHNKEQLVFYVRVLVLLRMCGCAKNDIWDEIIDKLTGGEVHAETHLTLGQLEPYRQAIYLFVSSLMLIACFLLLFFFLTSYSILLCSLHWYLLVDYFYSLWSKDFLSGKIISMHNI